MNRDQMLNKCTQSNFLWDVIIIGGGATGLGVAVDAASRGFKTLLLEQSDFAKGTSSKSTKLIHGGLRYLKQGNLKLVKEGLEERGRLFQNAPHLVHHLPFLVPHYSFWEIPYYKLGMKIYDFLSGKRAIEKSETITAQSALLKIPTLEPFSLKGATVYYDGQFDDSRLSITLALTAVDNGACILNYMKATSFLKESGKIIGVNAEDQETGLQYTLKARSVINAAGVFCDSLRKMDDENAGAIISPSQGIHITLPRKFCPSDTAILIPKTKDGRVVFCIPWYQHVIIGTTDTPVETLSLDPIPRDGEIDFLLQTIEPYLTIKVKKSDILSVFTGIRPLVRKKGVEGAKLSRNHEIFVSPSGLITIAGGKWTTYRKMAEETVDKAIEIHKLQNFPCITKNLKLHGYQRKKHAFETSSVYGTFLKEIDRLSEKYPHLNLYIHPNLPYKRSEIVWAVKHEMARTVEDVLARRTRCLFLDAKASIESCEMVAEIIAHELGKDKNWKDGQTQSFKMIAQKYLIHGV